MPPEMTDQSPLIYLQAASAAIAPSAAAVVPWRTVFERQSPATNTPGVFVVQASSEPKYPQSLRSAKSANATL